MVEAATPETPPGLSPSEAFALAGNEHRVAILEGLLAIQRRGGAEYPASFTALRRAAGIENSAQFNYHLGELTGHYLERSEAGYAFRVAGWELVTSILAGTYNQRRRVEGAAIDGSCGRCRAAALVATYLDEWLSIECRACGSTLTSLPVPPGAIAGRSPDEFARVFDRHVRTRIRLARERICPACTGPMRPVVGTHDAEKTAGTAAGYWCERCGNRFYPAVGAFLLDTRPVREFYAARGRDVQSTPFWEFRPCVDDLVTVTGERPWRAAVRFPLEDTLVVELDAELSITSTRVLRS